MKRLLHTLLLLLATLPAAAQLSDRPAEIRREVLAAELPAPDRSMRPVVGISVNEQARNSVRSTYTEAIEQAGGLPVIIPMSQNTDVLAEQLSRIDALVLIGGPGILGRAAPRASGRSGHAARCLRPAAGIPCREIRSAAAGHLPRRADHQRRIRRHAVAGSAFATQSRAPPAGERLARIS